MKLKIELTKDEGRTIRGRKCVIRIFKNGLFGVLDENNERVFVARFFRGVGDHQQQEEYNEFIVNVLKGRRIPKRFELDFLWGELQRLVLIR